MTTSTSILSTKAPRHIFNPRYLGALKYNCQTSFIFVFLPLTIPCAKSIVKVITIKIVDTAAISGVILVFILSHIARGSVLVLEPAKNMVTVTSSMDVLKANIDAENIEALI